MNLGKAIKFCRTQRKMKLSEVAELAHLSVSYLSLLERGKRDPAFSRVQHIASALNIPLVILLFIAERDEIHCINQELAVKLSCAALQLTGSPAGKSAKIPK